MWQVYTSAAHGVVESVLAGRSGAVLMYGATGSGKTWTMLGGPADQGILPRALKAVCRAAAEMAEPPAVHFSMMELHNEVAILAVLTSSPH